MENNIETNDVDPVENEEQKRRKILLSYVYDDLCKSGDVELAEIHGEAQRMLYIDSHVNNVDDIKYCDCCCLPKYDNKNVKYYKFSDSTKNFIKFGTGIYLLFFYAIYCGVCLLSLLISAGVPFVLIYLNYYLDVRNFCKEFYIPKKYENNSTTKFYIESCTKFTAPLDYSEYNETSSNTTSNEYNIDITLKFSSEMANSYLKIKKELSEKFNSSDIYNKSDVININYVSIMGSVSIIFISIMFIILTQIIIDESNYEEITPSRFSLMITNLKGINDFPILKDSNHNTINFKCVNIVYKTEKVQSLIIKGRAMKQLIRHKLAKDINKTYYRVCIFCKRQISALKADLKEIDDQIIQELENKKQIFSNVCIVTFNTHKDSIEYFSQFPNSLLGKITIKFFGGCIQYLVYTVCRCNKCLNETTKSKLKNRERATVLRAPEPEDIIWANLEYNYKARILRRTVSLLISSSLLLLSFLITCYLNRYQKTIDKVEVVELKNIIKKYIISISISAVNAVINVLIGEVFKKLNSFEKHWTYTQSNLSLSASLTLLWTLNTTFIIYVSNGITVGWNNYSVLVSNLLMNFLSANLVTPLLSLACIDYLLVRLKRYIYVDRTVKKEKKYNKKKELLMKLRNNTNMTFDSNISDISSVSSYSTTESKVEKPLPAKDFNYYTQEELNKFYERPATLIFEKYATLTKNIIMAFFFSSIFPIGIIITIIGVVVFYLVEKMKYCYIYKYPPKVNHEICVFYINLIDIGLFMMAIGNYLFIGDLYDYRIIQIILLILFPIKALSPFAYYLRKVDYCGYKKEDNDLTYEQAFSSFVYDYEILNPCNRILGQSKYVEKLYILHIINDIQYLILLDKARNKSITMILNKILTVYKFKKQKNKELLERDILNADDNNNNTDSSSNNKTMKNPLLNTSDKDNSNYTCELVNVTDKQESDIPVKKNNNQNFINNILFENGIDANLLSFEDCDDILNYKKQYIVNKRTFMTELLYDDTDNNVINNDNYTEAVLKIKKAIYCY